MLGVVTFFIVCEAQESFYFSLLFILGAYSSSHIYNYFSYGLECLHLYATLFFCLVGQVTILVHLFLQGSQPPFI